VKTESVKLTAELVEAFAGTFLSPMYDNAQPTPEFHRSCWRLYCSTAELASVVAPREHAKSTALTHDYGLAVALFREENYIIIVSATEELAIGHLEDIAKELRDNEDLIREFKIKGLVVDSKTDIIVACEDGYEFRFRAKGSGQKMRGMKWHGKRPGLILCDDLEEDEQVESYDRRVKFGRWFLRALLPCRRRGGKVRVHGTILHEDALLARLQRPSHLSWQTLFFKAHAGFDDFSDILWEEQWPESRLRARRQTYIDDGDAPGYSQEYLNDPFDNSDAYLRKDDFLPLRWKPTEQEPPPMRIAVGCDFAVSKADKANRTSFTVGGEDTSNSLNIIDQYVGRFGTNEWTDLLFDIQAKWSPEVFFVEDGVIWKSVAPFIYKEMNQRGVWINFMPILPVKDKAVRGRDLQKRHRAGGVRFDKDALWYVPYEAELLRFTGVSDALQDDQFDSTAILAKGVNAWPDVEEEDFPDEEEQEMIRQDPRRTSGRNAMTGY
jgi:hypothetical protein